MYGINSAAAGTALQTAMGNPSIAAGTQLTGLPSTLTVSTTTTVPAYYLVPSGATWQSIANAVYGINSAAAGTALQTAMGNPSIATGTHLTNLPSTLTVSTTTTVPAYYLVPSGATWASVTQAVYGTSDANAVTALQNAVTASQGSLPSLTANYHLTVPATLTYTPTSSISTETTYLQTTVTDPLTLTTTYTQNALGQLTQVQSPAVNGTPLTVKYDYDAQGNVKRITQDPNGLNRITDFFYDNNSNLTISRDNLGNTLSRTYDPLTSQLLTETSYITPDPDAINSGASPTNPLTTHYVYDSNENLRFIIKPQGDVTEYRYNAQGERTSQLTYTTVAYTGSTFTEAQLASWAGALGSADKSAIERIDYTYDFRGNLSTATAYASTDSAGNGVAGTASKTQYVYDQRGQLLQKIDPRGNANTPSPSNTNIPYATTYAYDSLGRLTASTQWVSNNIFDSKNTYTTLYNDTNHQMVTTYRNGLTTTTVYDGNGRVVSVNNTGSGGVNATTTYSYDADGRLRMVTDDSTGLKQYTIYDEAGRDVADIDATGSLTQHVYNGASQQIKSVHYADALSSSTLTTLTDANGNPANITLSTLLSALPTTVGRARDQISRTVYDSAGRVVYTIDPTGAVTQKFYDGLGRVTDTVQYGNPVSIASTVNEVRAKASDLAAGNSNTTRTFTDTSGTTVGTLALDNVNDRRTHYFYDGDGNLTGTLDAGGYLVESLYNAAGQHIQQIAYANKTSAPFWVTGTLASVRPATDNETTVNYVRDISTYYYYNGEGQIVGTLDGEGYLTENIYDVAGQLTQTIRYNKQLSYNASFSSLKSGIAATDSRFTTIYTYDGAGRVQTKTQREGTSSSYAEYNPTSYAYDGIDDVLSTTVGTGTDVRTTQAQYDALGRITKTLSAEGSYQISQGMAAATAWSRYGTSYTYDQAGRKTSATANAYDPNAGTTQTSTTYYYYNEDGQLRFTVDALGERTENQYNPLGQLTNTIKYFNLISTNGLSGGLLTTALTTTLTANADASKDAKVSYTYDLDGRVLTSSTAEGQLTTDTYTTFGQLYTETVKMSGSQSILTRNTYDTRGLLTQTALDPAGVNHTENYSYDAFGRRYQTIDQYGNTTKVDFDRLGRTVATYDALNNKSSVTYDAFSRTVTTTDANQNTTHYQYDDVNRKVTVTAPTNSTVITESNALGQTIKVTDASGVITTTTYDHDGNQVDVTTAAGTSNASTTHYKYDSVDRTVTVIEGYGTTAGTVNGVYSAGQRETQYRYDAAGRRSQEIVKNAQVDNNGVIGTQDLVTQYKYDAKGNLTRKIDPANNSTWYVYDRDGRLRYTVDATDTNSSSPTYGKSGVTETTYDAAGDVTGTRRYANAISSAGFGDVVTSVSVTADASNDRIEQDVYDNAGRQIYKTQNVVINGAAKAVVTQMDYDANGNVIKKTVYANGIAQGTYTQPSDISSKITADPANDRMTRTVYDADGRAEISIDAMGGVTKYTYDADGNVIQTTQYAATVPMDGAMQLWYVPSTNSSAQKNLGTFTAGDTLTATVRFKAAPNTSARVFLGDAGGPDPYDNAVQSSVTYGDDGWQTLTVTWTMKHTDNMYIYIYGDRDGAYHDATHSVLYDNVVVTSVQQGTVLSDDFSNGISGWGISGSAQPATVSLADVGSDAAIRTFVSSLADPTNDRTTKYWYDSTNRLRFTLDANGNLTETQYNDAARTQTRIVYVKQPTNVGTATTPPTPITNAGDQTTKTVFDEQGRIYRVYDATQTNYEQYTYDAVGNKVSYTNQKGDIWHYEYDANRRMIKERSPAVDITTMAANGSGLSPNSAHSEIDAVITYDALGNVASRTEAANLDGTGALANLGVQKRTTRYTYDQLGRQIRVDYPKVGVYNSATDVVDPNQQLSSYVYYDALGNAYKSIDVAGGVSYKTYDQLGRVINDIDAMGYVTQYGYDAFGNQTTLTRFNKATASTPASGHAAVSITSDSTNDRTITTTYDRLNRKIQVTQPAVHSFDPNANTSGGTYFTASPTTNYQYNAFGQVILQQQLLDPTTNSYADTHYYYNRDGQKTAEVDPMGYLTTYGYDQSGNLTDQKDYSQAISGYDLNTYSAPTFTSGTDHETKYTYDQLNRKTSQTIVGVQTATINGSTVTLASKDQVTNYGYDAVGNQTVTTLMNVMVNGVAQNSSTYTYYDALGRVIAIAQATRDPGDGSTLTPFSTMARDAFGDLVEAVDYAGGTTAVPTANTLPTAAAAPTGTSDRTTMTLFDADGHAIQTFTVNSENGVPENINKYMAYNARGDVAKQWQNVTVAVPAAALPSGVANQTLTAPDGVTTPLITSGIIGSESQTNPSGSFSWSGNNDISATWTSVGSRLVKVVIVYTPAKVGVDNSSSFTYTSPPIAGNSGGTFNFQSPYNGSSTTYPTSGGIGSILSVRVYGQDAAGNYTVLLRSSAAYDFPIAGQQTLVTKYGYDALGRETVVSQYKDGSGASADYVEHDMAYNAFGEVIAKGIKDGSATSGQQELYQYDQVGRVWRTNSGDGVTKVYLYDLAGNATAELRSQSIDLSSATYTSAKYVIDNVSASSLMRTETRYDLDNHVVEQRLPTFGISSSQLLPAVSNIQIGKINGPSNPLAFYTRNTINIPYVTPYYTYVVGSPIAGGYYLNPDDTYSQDATSVVNNDQRIYWDTVYDPKVIYTFQYRVAGSTGAYSQLTVGAVSSTQLAVDVQSLTSQSYEYVITYQRATDATPYAQSTGTFTIGNITTTSLTNITQNAVDPASTISTLAVNQTNGTVTWAAPSDTSVNAVLLYKVHGASSWAGTLTATRSGSNFTVNGQSAFATAGTYDYEIQYTRTVSGVTTVIAKNDGQLTSNGTSQSISGSDSENALTTFNQNVAAVSASGMTLSWAAPTGVVATGTVTGSTTLVTYFGPYSNSSPAWMNSNVVQLNWADVGPAKVRVVVNYKMLDGSAASYTQDVSGVNTGTTLSWNTDTYDPNNLNHGGISSITGISVYALDANNNQGALLRSSSLTGSSQGPNAFTAAFQYKQHGTSTYQTLSISQPVSGNWSVDVSSLTKGQTYDYQITYTLGGRVVSQQTGTFSITSATSTTTTTTSVGSVNAAATTAAVGTLSATSVVPVATGTVNASTTLVTYFGPYSNSSPAWMNSNVVQLNWADVGAAKVRVVVNYTRLDGSAASYTKDVSSVNTGTTLSWNTDTYDPNNLNHGGISTITGISVYALDANNNQGALLRSMTNSSSTLAIKWTESTGSYAPRFWYQSGSSWIEKAVTRSGSSLSVDLTGIASGTYNYYVGQFLPGAAYDYAYATGTFTTNGSSTASINSQTNTTRNPAAISNVAASGSKVTWTQALQSGTSLSFQYYNGSTWVSLPATNSSGNNYYVDFQGITSGQYNYQIIYKQTVSGDPATTTIPYAIATGSLSVTTTTTNTPSTLSVSAPTTNVSYATQRITPITLSSNTLSWSYGKLQGTDSIVVQYVVNGTTYTATVNGSGPAYSATMSQIPVGSNQGIPWSIAYTRSGESTPYAYASGTATLTVTNIQPTLTINSQTPVYPSGTQQIAAPTDLGSNWLGWTTAPSAGDTIVFKVDGTTLTTVTNGSGRKVDVSSIAAGTHTYSITYTHSGQSNPYALTSGSFTINRSTSYSGSESLVTPAPVSVTPSQSQLVDRWGNVIQSTDAAGNITNYRYNVLGQLIDTLAPSVNVVDTKNAIASAPKQPESFNYYDAFGQLIGTKDADGNINTKSYNAAGQEVSDKFADGSTKSFVYDAFGEQIQITDGRGYRTRNAYDQAGELVKTVQEITQGAFNGTSAYYTSFSLNDGTYYPLLDNVNVVTKMYSYDEAGRRISETSGSLANGSSTAQAIMRYAYDGMGNLVSSIAAGGEITHYQYDLEGHKTQQVDPLGGTLSWNYDYFGRYAGKTTTPGHVDMAGTKYYYTYDYAGDLLTQTSSAGQNITYTYDEAGHASAIDDSGVKRDTNYFYDKAGRVSREQVLENGVDFQDTLTTYDALNRISTLTDLRYTETYEYDAAGNRTHILANYYDHSKKWQTQDLWYTYDSMNRVAITDGVKTSSNTVGINSSQGTILQYDASGNRSTATTYGDQMIIMTQQDHQYTQGGPWVTTTSYSLGSGEYKETYYYDGLGRLTTTVRGGKTSIGVHGGTPVNGVSDNVLSVNSVTYNNASLEISDDYWSTDTGSGSTLSEHLRKSQYDSDGRMVSQLTGLASGGSILGGQTQSSVSFNYDAASNLTSYSSMSYTANDASSVTSTYTNKFVKAESYMDGGQTVNTPGYTPGDTTRSYNVDNELVSFVDKGQHTNDRYFLNGANGQPLVVIQGNYTDSNGNPVASDVNAAFLRTLNQTDNSVAAQYYFYSQGSEVGTFGQLQDSNGNYTASFDVNYTPVSQSYPSSTPSMIIAEQGDTLRTIALRAYGDASLWYLIADANGLTDPDAAITAGTSIKIPNRVVSLSNTSGTYKPFNMADALGNTSPYQQPMPVAAPSSGGGGCGVVGMIIMVIVAVVVTIFTVGAAAPALAAAFGAAAGTVSAASVAAGAIAGAIGAVAGSIVSQGVGILIGAQDGFSWNAVGKAAVGGFVTGGLGALASGTNAYASALAKVSEGNQIVASGLNAAVSDVVTQGVEVATGLQHKFSWQEVAASATGAAAGTVAGQAINESGLGANLNAAFGNTAGGIVTSTLTGIANGVAQTVVMGGKIDVTQIATNAFGTALGNSIGAVTIPEAKGGSSSGDNKGKNSQQQSGQTYSDDDLSEVVVTGYRHADTAATADLTTNNDVSMNGGASVTTEDDKRNKVIVRDGDTLMKIARRELGENASTDKIVEYAKQLAQINNLDDPNKIHPNQQLTLANGNEEITKDTEVNWDNADLELRSTAEKTSPSNSSITKDAIVRSIVTSGDTRVDAYGDNVCTIDNPNGDQIVASETENSSIHAFNVLDGSILSASLGHAGDVINIFKAGLEVTSVTGSVLTELSKNGHGAASLVTSITTDVAADKLGKVGNAVTYLQAASETYEGKYREAAITITGAQIDRGIGFLIGGAVCAPDPYTAAATAACIGSVEAASSFLHVGEHVSGPVVDTVAKGINIADKALYKEATDNPYSFGLTYFSGAL
ncbi:MAG: LysM peptidoglycan-binding domain-containing protein [Steroidobacter sp.]